MSKAPDGRPIRVLRVIARLNMGGPALHVTYLAQGLATRGYETTLVAGDVARGEESMAFVADRAGVEIMRLPGLSRELSPVRDAVAAWRVARIIRRVRPDVVHTHTAKAGAIGRVAAFLARPWRRPVVVHTFHGHVLRGYFGHAGTLLFRAIETGLALTTDRLVAVSPEVRDELVALHVAPRAKFSVVRLGIELEPRVRFDGDPAEVRRRQGIAAHKFVVGWFGRMTAVKRTDDLLTMLAALRERGVDALLLLVGDGDDRERLEQRAHDTCGRTSRPAAIDQRGLRGERAGWLLVLHLPGRSQRRSVVSLLHRMMRRRSKPVHLVLDGLPAHKTTLVKTYVASTKGMLTLHFLPGYAPELNPDELVWSHMKRTGVARAPLRRGEKLQAKIEAQLSAIKRMPQLIRSFFKAPSVAYITD